MFGFKKKKKVEKEKKITKHQKELLKQYEEGRILQVDRKTDNKEYFKNLDNKNKVIEEIKEDIQETNLDELPYIEPKKIVPKDKKDE